MNMIEHYNASRKAGAGYLTAIGAMLPDLFPYRMHNTLEASSKMDKFGLGLAWRLHRIQDLQTHEYKYDYYDILPKDCIFLMSGGLDSFIQWRLLGEPPAVYFVIDHRAEPKEFECINKISDRFGKKINICTDLNFRNTEFENGYIPFRNLYFIMTACKYSQNVVIAQIAEWAPDKNKQFYRHAEKLLKEIGQGKFQDIDIRPKIYAPFAGYTKTQLIKMYASRWSAEDLTKYTVSCYSNHEKNCGKCNSCISRYIGMKNNGIDEAYEEVPDITDITARWSVKDFKFSQVGMYYKRYMEIRQFKKENK